MSARVERHDARASKALQRDANRKASQGDAPGQARVIALELFHGVEHLEQARFDALDARHRVRERLAREEQEDAAHASIVRGRRDGDKFVNKSSSTSQSRLIFLVKCL